MKKLILLIALTIAATQPARAQMEESLPAEMQTVVAEYDEYIELLLERDVIRSFYSPCSFSDLKADREIAAMQLYFRQGFVLLAKVKLGGVNQRGHGIPECMYTFIRSSHIEPSMLDAARVKLLNVRDGVISAYRQTAVKVRDTSSHLVGIIRGLFKRQKPQDPMSESTMPETGVMP